jgi:hypothetical protein
MEHSVTSKPNWAECSRQNKKAAQFKARNNKKVIDKARKSSESAIKKYLAQLKIE